MRLWIVLGTAHMMAVAMDGAPDPDGVSNTKICQEGALGTRSEGDASTCSFPRPNTQCQTGTDSTHTELEETAIQALTAQTHRPSRCVD